MNSGRGREPSSVSPHTRPFRFGIEVAQPFEGRTWSDSARLLEDLGYETLFVPDHVHSPLGPLVAMAAALAATTRLKVAPLVMAVDFRNPVFLAKEIATLDALFPGRIEIGLGAGYNPLDYSRSGIDMPSPGARVSHLAEYVRVLRLLFTGEEFSFDGDEHRLVDVTGLPRPVTPGGPPILVAGGGPRLLRLAASTADIVGVNPSTRAGRDDPATFRDALPSSIDAKIDVVRTSAGPRWSALELHAWVSVARMTDRPREVVAALAERTSTDADDALGSPIVLVGSEHDVTDRLRERRERWGYSYVCLPQAATEQFAPVVAALRGA
jgi:probable F420-dependent oxidoreductase